jgi:hypothetical protein
LAVGESGETLEKSPITKLILDRRGKLSPSTEKGIIKDPSLMKFRSINLLEVRISTLEKFGIVTDPDELDSSKLKERRVSPNS